MIADDQICQASRPDGRRNESIEFVFVHHRINALGTRKPPAFRQGLLIFIALQRTLRLGLEEERS